MSLMALMALVVLGTHSRFFSDEFGKSFAYSFLFVTQA